MTAYPTLIAPIANCRSINNTIYNFLHPITWLIQWIAGQSGFSLLMKLLRLLLLLSVILVLISFVISNQPEQMEAPVPSLYLLFQKDLSALYQVPFGNHPSWSCRSLYHLSCCSVSVPYCYQKNYCLDLL